MTFLTFNDGLSAAQQRHILLRDAALRATCRKDISKACKRHLQEIAADHEEHIEAFEEMKIKSD